MQRLITRQSKIFFLVMFIVTVAACSLKTIYNRLDYLIPSYVEGMVSLDDVLEEKVEQRTLTLINWHRNTQLTQYADLLRRFQQDLQPDLTEAQVSQHISSMEILWQPLADKINQEMADLLPLLDAEQRDELFASIDDKNEDFYQEYIEIDAEERIEQYTDEMLDFFDNWLGELSEQQQRDVESAAYGVRSGAELRLQERKHWQQNIQKILQSSDTSETKSERLGTFFANFKIEENAELAAVNKINSQVFSQLTVRIVKNLTADQKQYFIDKTNDYIRIFTELAENR